MSAGTGTPRLAALDLVEGFAGSPDTPLSAMIEIADRCNEVCVHCYQVQGQKGEMTTEQLHRVMDELASMGVLFLTLSGGEPTLRPDFLDLVAYARKLRFAVRVFTNGLTMTEELARSLSELAVQWVEISLYSHRPEVHDWITRVPGSWAKSSEGVRRLRAHGVAVIVKAPAMRLTADDLPAWAEYVRSLGADYRIDSTLDAREDGDRTPEALNVTPAQLHGILTDPSIGGAESPPVPPARADSAFVCGACRGGIHIEPDGEVRPCTSLEVALGNAVTDGLSASWARGDRARAIRGLAWRDLHGCRDCDLRHYCKRCFATARHDEGDALGPYRAACSGAIAHYRASHGVHPRLAPPPTPERDPSIGPYRKVGDHAFEPIPDVRTQADEALAHELGWTRRDRVERAPDAIVPGELVQIRRPGKKPGLEQVPAASVGADRAEPGGHA